MKRYELKLEDGGRGVFKVSVVKDPAIESTLVHFSKEEKEIHYFADEEKRVIYSVVMRPQMDIFRKNINGEPAKVFYTKETVEKAQINYFRQNGNAATNINHSDLSDAEGIFPFESWIVTDAKNDRAVNFGLDVLDGDWVMGLKVDNDELWEEHIKTGKLDGFSVEATNINYELKEDTKMSKEKKGKKSVVAFLKEGFDKMFVDAEKFEGEIAEVSKWWQTVVNTTFEIGDLVERKPLEGESDSKPVNAGEFELEDGRKILTDSEGIIRFIFPAAGETPASETPAEKMAREKMEAETEETPEEKTTREAKEAADAETEETPEEKTTREAKEAAESGDTEPTEQEQIYLDKITALETEITTLKADAVKKDTALEKMKKETPAAKKIENAPKKEKSVPYEKMSNFQKAKFNKEHSKY